MLEQQSFLLKGGLEVSKSRLLQAIRGLEDERLTRCGRDSKTHSQPPGYDISKMGNSVRQSSDNLSVVPVRLFHGEPMDDIEVSCGRRPNRNTQKNPKAPLQKRLPSLRREYAISGRPGLDPRLLQLESLLNFNILETGRFLGGLVQKRYFGECLPYVKCRKIDPGISITGSELALYAINQAVSRFLSGQLPPLMTCWNHEDIADGRAPSGSGEMAKSTNEFVPCAEDGQFAENSSSSQGSWLETGQQLDREVTGTPFTTKTDDSYLEEEEYTVKILSSAGKEASREMASSELIASSDVKNEEAVEKAVRIDRALQNIMNLIGLHTVKTHISKLKSIAETSIRQGVELKEGQFGTVFLGNTGTGKTTVARSYAQFLSASGIAGGDRYMETSGLYLADGGICRTKEYIDDLAVQGGVLFVDDAHQLTSSTGKKVMAFMLQEIENKRGKVIFVLAGSEIGMREAMGTGNGNLGNLIPYQIVFQDFTDEELVAVMSGHIEKKFGGKMKVEGGFAGPYIRIATRRIGKTRGTSQFGNARAIENLVAKIWERQSARLDKLRLEKEGALGVKIAKAAEDQDTGTLVKGEIDLCKNKDGIDSFKKANDLVSSAKVETETATCEKSGGEVAERVLAEGLSTENDLESDYFFTKEDILGPSPTDALLTSEAWKKLQRLTGLKAVKESIGSIFELSKTNYQRELEEKPMLKLCFNRLFLGPPGTGKTVVAKLYGQILAEIGVLSKGQLLVRNPSDLIGNYIGDSEANTKAALSTAMGNVLVLDEAYMMYTGSSDGIGNRSDSFRRAVIDTLVAEVQSEPGDDRCVLMLGYGDQMLEMLQNANPGLARRFPIEDAFWFHDFTLGELESILRTKLEDNYLDATEEAIKVAMDMLDRARQRPNFGNGGEVENLISKAKINYQTRISAISASERPAKWVFSPEDFDPNHDRAKSASLNLHKLFSDVVGCETIIKRLEQYQRAAQAMKKKNINFRPFIPTNFIFKGPPGTGKTTTARKIAQVYYDMGFLSEATVVECTTSDLMGTYAGHTGPKTMQVLERSLGKVLFIDEAYRLAKEGCNFASEVISELVDNLTKPKFHGRLIVILAGSAGEMNHLLRLNPGLASRFPEELIFPSPTQEELLAILKTKLGQAGVALLVAQEKGSVEYKNAANLICLLAQTPGWGNAREADTLAKRLCREAFIGVGDGVVVCDSKMLTQALEELLVERRARGRMNE